MSTEALRADLLASLAAAVRSDGEGGATTAADLRGFLTQLVDILTSPSSEETVSPKDADYTLAQADAGRVVPFSAGATCTIPPDAFAPGVLIEIAQEGPGQVTIAGAAGVTLQAAGGLKTAGQWASVGLRCRAANEWVITNGVA